MAANGELTGRAEDLLLKAVVDADIIYGIDGGTRHFLRHQIIPTLVTGDFDSLSPDERAYLLASGTDVIHTPDQDYTDLEKALTIATSRHPKAEITIFGGTGGRLDHQHSVLSTLTSFGRRHRIQLVDSHGTTFHAQSGLILNDDALSAGPFPSSHSDPSTASVPAASPGHFWMNLSSPGSGMAPSTASPAPQSSSPSRKAISSYISITRQKLHALPS